LWKLEEAQAELASAIEEAEKHPPGALQLLAMQVRLPFGGLPQAAALFQRTAQLIEPGSFSGPDPWQAGADALWMLFYFLRGDLRSAVLAESAHFPRVRRWAVYPGCFLICVPFSRDCVPVWRNGPLKIRFGAVSGGI
jgi:hypothetical protein